MLVGRDREQRAISRLLADARGVLALTGEPGIGKSSLLDWAAEQAAGRTVLRARGVPSEARIPFAGLFELLRPALAGLEQLPAPQAEALESALALRPAHAHDRFAVGAATLGLLAESAPLVVLIDDAQWLDGATADALRFALRRLLADPIAVVLTAREDEPSLLDDAGLPTLRVAGLSGEEAATLLGGVSPEAAARLHRATGGNPLALLEMADDAEELALAPEGAPVLVSARIARAFLRRFGGLDEAARRALVLVATSGQSDLALLERAGVDAASLAGAEAAGLVTLRGGRAEFRHPLAGSAIYADASAGDRRAAHRALAASLPDRDVDRRAWHLAAAATGTDEPASAALEQAGIRSRDRSAYATATAAFERAGRLAGADGRRARLLLAAGEAAWLAGLAERALALLDEARAAGDGATVMRADQLAGHIATRRGPVMRGHAILTAAAARADPERAVAMLAEATGACFYAGAVAEMLASAERVRAALGEAPSVRARFLAAISIGMASTVGGDAAAGAEAMREGIALAERAPELRDDLQLLPWLAIGPIFLREAGAGRSLLEEALQVARARAALGVLPFVLSLIGLDQATTDRLPVAEATFREAIALARETGQRTDLVFALAAAARLDARRGREAECRAGAAETLALSAEVGARLHEVWARSALAELELALGAPERALEQLEHQERLLTEMAITDVDLSPAPGFVDVHLRLGSRDDARRAADGFLAAAEAKGQPWSLARALRCQGMVSESGEPFEAALAAHAQTPDAFEAARTRLAYGAWLRRSRNRVRAREQLRAAMETFERLDAHPWAETARSELAASGERLRRRDPSSLDELTPQELQIALLLASGKTTRETAAAVFLSPKTIEYHQRHVYLKLGVHSREELAQALE